MTTKKFITKNRLQTQNIDFTSPDETKLFPIALGNDGVLSIKDGNTVLININSNGSLQIPVATSTWKTTTIATTKGGAGLTSYNTGDLIYASSANTLTTLTTSTEGKVLQLDASSLPIWGDIDVGIC